MTILKKKYVVSLQGRGTFPCDVSVLDIQQELEWNPNVSCINSWPLSIIDDGAVLYYRCVLTEGLSTYGHPLLLFSYKINTLLKYWKKSQLPSFLSVKVHPSWVSRAPRVLSYNADALVFGP